MQIQIFVCPQAEFSEIKLEKSLIKTYFDIFFSLTVAHAPKKVSNKRRVQELFTGGSNQY